MLNRINGFCTSIAANNTWVIGYNDQLITGVWVGNADGNAMNSEASGLSTASPIWRHLCLKQVYL